MKLKKLVAFLLAAVMVFSLAACGGGAGNDAADGNEGPLAGKTVGFSQTACLPGEQRKQTVSKNLLKQQAENSSLKMQVATSLLRNLISVT